MDVFAVEVNQEALLSGLGVAGEGAEAEAVAIGFADHVDEPAGVDRREAEVLDHRGEERVGGELTRSTDDAGERGWVVVDPAERLAAALERGSAPPDDGSVAIEAEARRGRS